MSSPESGLTKTKTSPHPPQTIPDVSTKTEDTTNPQLNQDEDIDLIIKDNENNQMQKKILELYFASKKKGPKINLVENQESSSSATNLILVEDNKKDPNLNPLKSNDYF